MHSIVRQISGLFIGLQCVALFAGPANADSLSITASGSVASVCSISVATNFPTANLSASGTVGATGSVTCNSKWKINATSAKGAMKAVATAPANFTNSQPYNLTVSVPLDQGGSASATCASALLVAGQSSCALSPANSAGLNSGTGTSFNKTAALTAAWTIPTLPTRLIAGSYSDTITLTIAALP